MSAEDILHMSIGCNDMNIYSINSWRREKYNNIAILMELNPKDYKNKNELFRALGDELQYYLFTHPDIKKEVKELLRGSDFHYLYDSVYNEEN